MTLPSTGAEFDAYTGIVQLANFYMAIHVEKGIKTIISGKMEKDARIAEVAAQSFALRNHIPYHCGLLQFNKPLITVVKDGSEWFPAALYPNKVFLMTEYICREDPSCSMSLRGTQEDAIVTAKAISRVEETEFNSSIGIALSRD